MFAGRWACPEPRRAWPEGRRVPAFELRPGHPSRRKNPLSPLLPLDSVHSPISPLFPLHTRNLGGGASCELRRIRSEPVTNTVVTQQVSTVRRQLKYYLNCRHADILQWHSHSWLCSSQKPSTGTSACATTRRFGRYGLQPVRSKVPSIRHSHAGRCNRQDRLLARSASAGLLLPDRRSLLATCFSAELSRGHLLRLGCAQEFSKLVTRSRLPCLSRSALQAAGEEPS